ncbi:S-layer homology domain-containing protein [Patescibacteria group bacterium]
MFRFISDVRSTDWFFDDVAKLVEWGVSEGYSDESFKPGNYVTRAELDLRFK